MATPNKHRGKWRIRWIDENGRRRSAVLPTYRDAQIELKKRELEVDEIQRGDRVAIVEGKTFDDLADHWRKHRAPQKRSGKDDESIIRKHLGPAFGALRLREINAVVIDPFVAVRKGKLDDKTINNILTLLITMLHKGCELGWLAAVPKIAKPRIAINRRDFQYLRSREEVDRFLAAARMEGDDVFALYAVAVFTGMRAGEIAALEWGDVNLDQRIITVARSFGGPTKSDAVRRVPILDALLPILREWKLKHPGRLVFTNRDGRMHGKSARIFQEVLHRVLARARFERVMRRGKLRPAITFHGLRHTFASLWMMNGGDIYRLQKILGHASITMTERYSHLAPDAYAGDLGRLGSAPITTPAAVIPIARRPRGVSPATSILASAGESSERSA